MPNLNFNLSITTFDDGTAMVILTDVDDPHEAYPIAESEGATPDEAVQALFSKITFNGESR